MSETPQPRLRLMLRHKSIMPMILAFTVGVFVLAVSAPWWIWLVALLGIPLQMLNEYSLHRHIFHLSPPKTQWKFDILYQAHYGHHEFPSNVPLFFAPAWVTLPILVINCTLVWAIASFVLPAHAVSIAVALVMVGGIGTFLAYEWFHMTAHLPVKKTWIEQHVAGLHAQHHFRDFSRWYHVSPGGHVIDRMMGTAIDRDALKAKQRIEFIKTLGLQPDDVRLVAARNRFAGKYGLSAEEISAASKA